MADAVVFDAGSHIYRLGEKRLASVTEVLNHFGLISEFAKQEAARERGQYVHEACQYLDEGKLDWATVDPAIRPYVEAWQRCKADLGIRIVTLEDGRLAIEIMVHDEQYGYAGMLDRLVFLAAFQSNWPAILDLKTGEIQEAVRLQLAGYGHGHRVGAWFDRIAVQLKPGSEPPYVIRRFEIETYYRDRDDFLALLRALSWQRRCGVINKEALL